MGPRAALAFLGLLALSLVSCAASSRFPVDGERALARVRRQVEAGPRIPGTPGHRAVLEWMVTELERLGGRVERQVVIDSSLGRRLELTNVIAHFGPEDGRRLAFGAHWDTRPWSDQDPDTSLRDVPVPGANDGGSGVAVLFEIAELMSRRAPPCGIDLLFFDGEDQGRATMPREFCLGSAAYATRIQTRPEAERPLAAFVFDMVGDRDLAIHPEVQGAARASNLVELVLEGARATGARHFQAAPRFNVDDDHVRLLDAGIPAVDIIDFDYPAWHTPRDLPDQVSAASLAEVAAVGAWLVYRSPLARAARTRVTR